MLLVAVLVWRHGWPNFNSQWKAHAEKCDRELAEAQDDIVLLGETESVLKSKVSNLEGDVRVLKERLSGLAKLYEQQLEFVTNAPPIADR